MTLVQSILDLFKKHFAGRPLLVRSPGRINLLGEHTDYNMGFVLPAAIDKAIYFALARREDRLCRVMAADVGQEIEFSIDHLGKSQLGWPNYLMGVIDQLDKNGLEISGFNCVFGGDIPLGAGLSSSAALAAGLAFALNRMNRLGIDPLSLVKLAQKAENEFVGVQCGIMDPYVNIFGSKGHVLRIDCRSLENTPLPFDYDQVALVLFNTNLPHSLAFSEYNRRRRECAAGVAAIRERFPQVDSLRDVSGAMLNSCQGQMAETLFRRCRYVIGENERLLQAGKALNERDLRSFGRLMFATHAGLRDDFQVSCAELDHLVELAQEDPQVYGARMMGGGFGGCTVNLIEAEAVERVSVMLKAKYVARFGREPGVHVTSTADGTGIL